MPSVQPIVRANNTAVEDLPQVTRELRVISTRVRTTRLRIRVVGREAILLAGFGKHPWIVGHQDRRRMTVERQHSHVATEPVRKRCGARRFGVCVAARSQCADKDRGTVQGCLPKRAKSSGFLWITFSLDHDRRGDILPSSPSEGSLCVYSNRLLSAGMISRNLYPISCCDDGSRSVIGTGVPFARHSDRGTGSVPPCSSASSA